MIYDFVDLIAVTGFQREFAPWLRLRYESEAGGALDAPRFMPAGYMACDFGGEYFGQVVEIEGRGK